MIAAGLGEDLLVNQEFTEADQFRHDNDIREVAVTEP